MKKILTILTSLLVAIAPASQIISCEITTNNAYKQHSDIAKFWNTKLFNTISLDLNDDTQDDALPYKLDFFENDLKKLIANNFNNQGDVNEVLGINDAPEPEDPISFKYYYSKNVKSIIGTIDDDDDDKGLKKYIGDNFQKNHLKEIEIYFKYSFRNETWPEEENDFLSINVTNVPKMVKGVFATGGIFDSTLKDQTEIYISNYYVNPIKTVNPNEGITLGQDEKDKTIIVNFLKGFLQSIEDITKIKLEDSLVWQKTTNPSSDSYYWTRITPEEQLFNLIALKDIEDFINELIKKGSSKVLNNFLGLDQKINFVVKN